MTSSNASPPNVKQNRNDQCRCGDTETYTHTHTCRISWPWGVAKGARLCSEIVKFPWSKGHSTSIANTHTHMQKMPVTAAASGKMVRNCKMTKLSCLAVWDYEQLCAHSSLHALCMAQPSFVIQQVNILWLHLWISWWFSSTFSTHFLWATHSTFHTSCHVLWATLCARLVCLLATLFMYVCVCVFIYYIDMYEI